MSVGLQHAIENHKYMDLNIDVQPSYVIVPENGVYKENANMLVLDLGSLKMKSLKNDKPMISRVGSTGKTLIISNHISC